MSTNKKGAADEIRLMLPATRNAMPRWELTRDGKVIGWIQETQIGRSTRHFFNSIGIDPENGNHVNLESSTDFDERVRVIQEFHLHPEASVHRDARIFRDASPGGSYGRLG